MTTEHEYKQDMEFYRRRKRMSSSVYGLLAVFLMKVCRWSRKASTTCLNEAWRRHMQ